MRTPMYLVRGINRQGEDFFIETQKRRATRQPEELISAVNGMPSSQAC